MVVAHGLPTYYALDSVQVQSSRGFIYLILFKSFDKKREKEYCLMALASILLKRPVLWLSLLAPPLLHIFGLRFLHLLITSTALFISSLFFPILLPHSSIQSTKQEEEQYQDQDYVAAEDITGKSEDYLGLTNKEDEDGTIPDEESLFELSLPSGHYVGHHHTSNKNNLYIHKKVQDFKLFDLFNDFIEEDNLIEIDISIGCIKYSRFEIKA
ncbi:hypothetical protein EUTSA_v10002998mg [Eutrema salsugineum]|uniref:Uncharacterized protein n=1 Tax=Eutrema salsugineum TaxID=72664 RepID=V4L411_EUTSA|nr:hypothetical protein EUTSA_v10002998mg [Eutrema salsugineum]